MKDNIHQRSQMKNCERFSEIILRWFPILKTVFFIMKKTVYQIISSYAQDNSNGEVVIIP